VKRYFTCVLDDTVGVVKTSRFSVAVDASDAPTAVETMIGVAATFATFDAATIRTVREAKLASWATAGVVRPFATTASQRVLAASVAVATVRVKVLGLSSQAPVNVVEPHVFAVIVTVVDPVDP
jgi:hypothetical protein